MTLEPSTSTGYSSCSSGFLRHEVLGTQEQNETAAKFGFKKTKIHEQVSRHPLLPIVELLFKKCEDVATKFDEESFEMDDVKNLFKEMEESGVRLSSEKNEVDLLMETAALALRQCMVEMERVYVLARCYKTKYLAILRQRVCHEALVGSNGDSDDEIADSHLLPSVRLPKAQNTLMESAFAAMQNSTGSIPGQYLPQSISMVPAQQIEKNLEILKQCGFMPSSFFASFEEAMKNVAGSNSQNCENSSEKSKDDTFPYRSKPESPTC